MFSRKLTRPIAVAAAAVAIGSGAYGIISATASNGSGTVTTATSSAATSGQPVPRKGGSNARSGPAAGGAAGTVDSVSTSGFAILTSAGQKVTITEKSSTTYREGTGSTSANAIKHGEGVLVLGTTNGATITASQVIVCNRLPAAGLRPPRRQGRSRSSAVRGRRRSRSVRSQRPTARARGRS